MLRRLVGVYGDGVTQQQPHLRCGQLPTMMCSTRHVMRNAFVSLWLAERTNDAADRPGGATRVAGVLSRRLTRTAAARVDGPELPFGSRANYVTSSAPTLMDTARASIKNYQMQSEKQKAQLANEDEAIISALKGEPVPGPQKEQGDQEGKELASGDRSQSSCACSIASSKPTTDGPDRETVWNSHATGGGSDAHCSSEQACVFGDAATAHKSPPSRITLNRRRQYIIAPDGTPQQFNTFVGHGVSVLYFYAAWCKPHETVTPELIALLDELNSGGVGDRSAVSPHDAHSLPSDGTLQEPVAASAGSMKPQMADAASETEPDAEHVVSCAVGCSAVAFAPSSSKPGTPTSTSNASLVRLMFINTVLHEQLSALHDLRSVPTFIVYVNGKIWSRIEGSAMEQLREALEHACHFATTASGGDHSE